MAWGLPTPLTVVAVITLDAGIQANHVVGQREVLGIQAATGSRLNSVYMGVFFAGGAAASSTAGPLFRHGWSVVAAAGALLALVALAVYLGLDAREGGRAVRFVAKPRHKPVFKSPCSGTSTKKWRPQCTSLAKRRAW